MWNSDTNFDYLEILPKDKKGFVEITCSGFRVPTKGLVLFFDIFNYEKYPVDSMWRNLGNHLNIKLGDGGNQKFPQEIEKIVNKKEYSHLVWLSKRAWDNSTIDFVWNLSHELRHLEQDLENRSISLAFYFLKYCLKFDMGIEEDRIQTIFPAEKDAELAAWRAVRRENLFGTRMADTYVRNNANGGPKKEVFIDLLKYDPNEEYDVSAETLDFLKKYKNQFEEKLNTGPDYYIKEIGSIEDLCRKLMK